jgi:dTDP-4-amino-4,6-dideoxygalactose transaminase
MGWKYNMDNIQAAMLLPQMDRLDATLARREVVAVRYNERLQSVPNVRVPSVRRDTVHARHIFPVWVTNGRRDEVVDGLQKAGIGVVVNYRPVHVLQWPKQAWAYVEGDFPIAERIGNETISLPYYPQLSEAEQDYVVETLRTLVTSRPIE